MSENFLPLILVSAVDLTNASKLISEIIDNEVTDSPRNLREGRVWRLENKYYRADVEVCAGAPGAPPPPGMQRLEAHVVLAEAEAGAAEAEARAAGCAHAAVRLLVAPGARVSPALADWARRRGYEALPLAARAAPGEAAGVRRAREALHAHPWRGLQRLDRPQRPERDESSDEEAEAVERAEAFADALGALADARGAATRAPDAERRRRAERAVAAFCRALGADLPL